MPKTPKRSALYSSLLVLFVIIGGIYWFNPLKSREFEELIELPTYKPSNFHQLNSSDTIFNLDFKYSLKPPKCDNNSNLLALIIVTSYFGDIETRSAMRRAFSDQELLKLGIRRVFSLGQMPKDDHMTSQNAIINESNRFHDLIQGNFIEAYRNLTYKHLMGLKWVADNCYRSKFVIKMDDDIVVDLRKLYKILGSFDNLENSIAGYVMKNMKAIREPANKWFVSKSEYAYRTYPDFVSGWFYITTPQIAQKLFLVSHYFQYFWIDDVFVTGILAKTLNVNHRDLRKLFAVHAEYLQCCVRDFKAKLDCDFIIGPNGGDNNLFYEFNKAVEICNDNSCTKRQKLINETCVTEYKSRIGLGSGVIEKYRLT